MEIGMNDAVDWISPLGFRDSKNELEAAIQRYADLYEFAPIAYVSLDRFGRIEESNLAAISLLERTRKQLLGAPFTLRVVKQDSELFLRHLRRCRSSKSRVETELCLKNRHGDAIPVQLSSSPSTSSRKNRALLYQTAIIDLRERKAAEKSLADAARQHKALYEFVERRHEAQRSSDIYAAALDAILSALLCDRASILLFDGQGVMRFVGGQISHTAAVADLVGVAKGCGIADCSAITTMAEVETLGPKLHDLKNGPRFANIKGLVHGCSRIPIGISCLRGSDRNCPTADNRYQIT